MVYYSSSAASSIYSQDGVIFPAPYDSDVTPLIERKDSSASTFSKLSQASTLAPTVYTEDYIKSLGYRPFEYWKGPLPKVYGPISENERFKRKTAPVPPPPRAMHRRSRAFRNSFRAFVPGSLPPVKTRHSRQRILDDLPLPSPPRSPRPPRRRPQPPPSPRVKDRYKHRYKLPRKEVNGEWPGWEPDEAVVRYFATRFANMEKLEKGSKPYEGGGGAKKEMMGSKTTITSTKGNRKGEVGWARFRSAVTVPFLRRDTGSDSGSIRLWGEREQFLKPSTWTRRSWGLVAALLVFLFSLIIFLVTMLSRNNDPLNKLEAQTTQQQAPVVAAGILGRGGLEDAFLRGVTDFPRRAVHGGSLFRVGPIQHAP